MGGDEGAGVFNSVANTAGSAASEEHAEQHHHGMMDGLHNLEHGMIVEMGIAKQAIYHAILFANHWFSGTHFDHHDRFDHDSLDHDHLDEYLHSKGWVSQRSTNSGEHPTVVAKRRSQKRSQIEANQAVKAARKSSRSSRSSASSAKAQLTDDDAVNAAIGELGVSPFDSPADINAAYMDKAKGLSNTDKLDKAYNTIMEHRQKLEEAGQLKDNTEDKNRGTESQIYAEMAHQSTNDILFHNPHFPRFIVWECIICSILWFANCIWQATKPENEFTFTIKGGLDSFVTEGGGMTELQWAGPLCENYKFQVWRWLSYQFSHVHLCHLCTNVFNALLLGTPLEGFHGHMATFIVFNAGVFGGAMLYYVWEAHVTVVGMSGGVCSLVGMRMGSLVMNWSRSAYKWTTIGILVFLLTMDAILNTYVFEGSKTSHTVHAGGGFAGFLSAIVFGRHLYFGGKQKVFYVLAIISFILMTGTCLFWLYSNEGPLTMREAMMEGITEGYCWWNQAYVPSIERTRYLCVKCPSEECVAWWKNQTTYPYCPQEAGCLNKVNYQVCDELGWYPNNTATWPGRPWERSDFPPWGDYR